MRGHRMASQHKSGHYFCGESSNQDGGVRQNDRRTRPWNTPRPKGNDYASDAQPESGQSMAAPSQSLWFDRFPGADNGARHANREIGEDEQDVMPARTGREPTSAARGCKRPGLCRQARGRRDPPRR